MRDLTVMPLGVLGEVDPGRTPFADVARELGAYWPGGGESHVILQGPMNLTKAIAELQEERTRIDQAIQVLSQFGSVTKRRGRPPKWLAEVKTTRQHKGRSAAARKAQSKRMKKYWAAKRKAQG